MKASILGLWVTSNSMLLYIRPVYDLNLLYQFFQSINVESEIRSIDQGKSMQNSILKSRETIYAKRPFDILHAPRRKGSISTSFEMYHYLMALKTYINRQGLGRTMAF